MKAMRWVLAVGLAATMTGAAWGDATSDVYKAKCASCHGADGLAATPMGKALSVRSFKAPADLKMSDDEMFQVTKNGKNKMPAYNGKLTDAQIHDLVKYIRTLEK